MATNDVVAARIIGSSPGGVTNNVSLHFQFRTTTASAADLAADLQQTLITYWAPALTSDHAVTGINVEAVMPNELATYRSTFGGSPIQGGLVEPSLPPQCAAVFKLSTAFKGGRRRGRFYFPALGETSVTGGFIGGAQVAALNNLAGGLLSSYDGGATANLDYQLVVWSPEDLTAVDSEGNPAPRVGNLITPVTTITWETRVRTQRRRAVGIGI